MTTAEAQMIAEAAPLILARPDEVWRMVREGHYEVSNHGRVRRVIPYNNTFPGRLLKPRISIHGYVTVQTNVRGVPDTTKVHRLVAEAFIGPRPDGLVINHKNGIKQDNRPENLEYCSVKENTNHAIDTGLRRRSIPRKMNPDKVRELIARRNAGERMKDLATAYGISKEAASRIFNRHMWKSIHPAPKQLDRLAADVATHGQTEDECFNNLAAACQTTPEPR